MKNLYLAAKVCFLVALFSYQQLNAQNMGSFSSVTPGIQSEILVLPPSHTFQRIIKSGDALTVGNLGNDLDFTGYVPVSGSSRNGYLSISSESTPAAVAIMSVAYNFTTHIWDKSNSGNVSFPTAAFGTSPVQRFCSGTVTPNGTIMVSEEQLGSSDTNADGYTDIGWILEINPVTKAVIESDALHTGVDKLWAIGRASRENAMIMPDNKTLYTGADNGGTSYVYKFVATTAGNFSSGQLYVLVTTAALGTGTWATIANTSQSQKNTTVAQSTSASAYSFNGVEDMEVSPLDGKIYFTAKGPGRIYRFSDNGTTVSNLEVFVENTTYDVDPGPAVASAAWGTGNDNLAFDGDGFLWVLQDGGNGHIWVVSPTHTAAAPAVRLFGKTPAGSEPTGITFTPDYKFMFISFQHPAAANNDVQTDAAGAGVVFNTHTTVVIGRIENLGLLATLPVKLTGFTAKGLANRNVALNFTAEEINNHSYFIIERSINGINFEEVYRNTESFSNGSTHSISHVDEQKTSAKTLYYRIKQCDINGACTYSDIKQVSFSGIQKNIRLYPSPAFNTVKMNYTTENISSIQISIINAAGSIVLSETRKVLAGENVLQLDIQKLKPGSYSVMVNEGQQKSYEKLIKL